MLMNAERQVRVRLVGFEEAERRPSGAPLLAEEDTPGAGRRRRDPR